LLRLKAHFVRVQLEFIVINDRSTDQSRQVLNDYA